MALTGKIQADFAAFLSAIEKADVALGDMAKGASGVEAKLNRMTDSFSGRKIIQEAVLSATAIEAMGGTSKLTASELERVGAKAAEAAEKLRKLGYEVPPGIDRLAESVKKVETATKSTADQVATFETAFRNPVDAAKTAALGLADSMGTVGLVAAGAVVGIGLVGAALFKFAIDTAHAGGALDDMADKTGLSVPALSRLQNAAKVVGADMGTLTDAIFKLEKGIGDNSDAFQKGIAKIGLSTNELKAAGPDRYLELVAVGLANIAEPAERAAAGAALFGKSYSNIAASLQDLAQGLQLTADIQPWSADDAARAEAFDQQIASIEVHVKALAESLGRDLIPAISTFVGWLKSAGSFTAEWVGKLSGLRSAFNTVSGVWDTAAAVLDVLRGKTGELPPELAKLASSADSAAEKMKKLKDAAYDAAHTPEKDVANWQAAAKALTGFGGAALIAKDSLEVENAAGRELTESLKESIDAHKKAEAAAKKLAEEQERLKKKYDETAASLERWSANAVHNAVDSDRMLINLRGLSAELPKTNWETNALALEKWQQNAAAGADSASELLKNLQGLGAQLPKTTIALTLGQSITAGLSQALRSIPQTLANAFTGGGGVLGAVKSVATGVGAAVGGGIGFALGGPLGSAIGSAIGSLAGPLVGGIAKLFQSAEKQINPVREAFVQLHGGLANLNLEATRAGTNLWALLQAKNADQYKKAIDDLNAAFERYDKWIEDSNTKLGDLIGTAQELAAKLPASMQPGIDKLYEMGRITGNNKGLLDSLMAGTEIDFKKMEDVAKKYGIELSALGPAFQQAKLSDTAKTIINDFDLLARNGADVDKILAGMKKPINDLVNESLKFKTTIPENMRPWIEQLLKTGQLTDENGDKITDLSELKFAAPIVTEFDKLIKKIQDLIDVLTLGLPAALLNIPSPKPITVPVSYRFDTDYPERPIPMASGGMGRVTKPTLFLAGESGAEDYAFSGGGKRFSGNSQTSNYGPANITINMTGVSDPRAFSEELRTALKQNRYGIRSLVSEAVSTV